MEYTRIHLVSLYEIRSVMNERLGSCYSCHEKVMATTNSTSTTGLFLDSNSDGKMKRNYECT